MEGSVMPLTPVQKHHLEASHEKTDTMLILHYMNIKAFSIVVASQTHCVTFNTLCENEVQWNMDEDRNSWGEEIVHSQSCICVRTWLDSVPLLDATRALSWQTKVREPVGKFCSIIMSFWNRSEKALSLAGFKKNSEILETLGAFH